MQLRTTYGNLLILAGGDLVDVWKVSQKSPRLSEKLQDEATVELLLGTRAQELAGPEEQAGSLTSWAYLFVLEGLHQLQHPTEGQREGGTGPPVAVRHLHAAVAEVPLPVRLAADLVLPEDVRYEVSFAERKTVRNEKWGGGGPGGGSRRHAGLTLAAGWGEVFHQGGEEVVELEEVKKERR